MSRFYVRPENVRANLIIIDGQEAVHVTKVMRLSENDKVTVFDGTGHEYTGFIKKCGTKSVTVTIVEKKIPDPEKLPEVTLAQAIPKKGRMDYIVQKATELGAARIIPFISERTIVRLDPIKRQSRLKRWRTIAKESAKQCGRNSITDISSVLLYKDVVKKIDEYDICIFAWLSDETLPLPDVLSKVGLGKIILFVGPEGDFTDKEAAMAASFPSCSFVSLGKRVLKSDTAGLYMLSCVDYELSR